MKLWEWIVVAVVLLLVWGKVSKKVVPKNQIPVGRPLVPLLENCSSGDNFAGGHTNVAGVCEPEVPVITPISRIKSCIISTANRYQFPVNPPIPIWKPMSGGTPPLRVTQPTGFNWGCDAGPIYGGSCSRQVFTDYGSGAFPMD